MLGVLGVLGYVPIMLEQQRKAREVLIMNNNQKPPTQGVGVSGFKADLYASDEVQINWQRLIEIPKFQMFAIEKSKFPYHNVMEWIDGYVKDQIRTLTEQAYFDQYVHWHDAKGYWKKENVYGDLL